MMPGVVNFSLKAMREDVGVVAWKFHKKVEA